MATAAPSHTASADYVSWRRTALPASTCRPSKTAAATRACAVLPCSRPSPRANWWSQTTTMRAATWPTSWLNTASPRRVMSHYKYDEYAACGKVTHSWINNGQSWDFCYLEQPTAVPITFGAKSAAASTIEALHRQGGRSRCCNDAPSRQRRQHARHG